MARELKSKCHAGHDFSPENTKWYKDGRSGRLRRHCVACGKVRQARRHTPKLYRNISYADCAICGKLFVVRRAAHPRDAARRMGCGAECRRALDAQRSMAWQLEYIAENGRRQDGRRRIPGLICEKCGAEFEGRSDHVSRYCSRLCYHALVAEKYAHTPRVPKRIRRKSRLKAARVGVVSRLAVFERDGWQCGICGDPIDERLVYPDRFSASLDHVIPLSAGGLHTMDNVQAAHWICNVRKGDRPVLAAG